MQIISFFFLLYRYLGNEILDMPVIDVGLPTGFFVEDEDLKKV